MFLPLWSTASLLPEPPGELSLLCDVVEDAVLSAGNGHGSVARVGTANQSEVALAAKAKMTK